MDSYAMLSSSHHTQADHEDQLSALKPKRMAESPRIASFGDGHRCNRFPCPVCHQGRSQQRLEPASQVMNSVQPGSHGHDQAAPVGIILFGDGGHTCRRFPCPICGNRSRRSATLRLDEDVES